MGIVLEGFSYLPSKRNIPVRRWEVKNGLVRF
jgi:hypothetical protein